MSIQTAMLTTATAMSDANTPHAALTQTTETSVFYFMTQLIAASHSKLSLFIDCSFTKM